MLNVKVEILGGSSNLVIILGNKIIIIAILIIRY